MVKRAVLANYRIVYFATHGLVAGDIKGIAQPSLALSLPKLPTALDDGLLTASQSLSSSSMPTWWCCRPATRLPAPSPARKYCRGSRAFFYAGTRALLVTHWALDSQVAARLTTSTFDLSRPSPRWAAPRRCGLY